MCCFPKAGWSARWQSLHKAGTAFLSRNDAGGVLVVNEKLRSA